MGKSSSKRATLHPSSPAKKQNTAGDAATASLRSSPRLNHGLSKDEVDRCLADYVSSKKKKPAPKPAPEGLQPSAKFNFLAQEDVLLAKAFSQTTTNAQTGTDQTKEKFWAAVFIAYKSGWEHSNSPGTVESRNRTAPALMTRWKNLMPLLTKFSQCYNQVMGGKKAKYFTGNVSEETLIKAALQLYLTGNDNKAEFKHVDVWLKCEFYFTCNNN